MQDKLLWKLRRKRATTSMPIQPKGYYFGIKEMFAILAFFLVQRSNYIYSFLFSPKIGLMIIPNKVAELFHSATVLYSSKLILLHYISGNNSCCKWFFLTISSSIIAPTQMEDFEETAILIERATHGCCWFSSV